MLYFEYSHFILYIIKALFFIKGNSFLTHCIFEPVREKTNNLGSNHTNRAVQSQKMVRGWQFWI